jgi:hypothetical protein
MSDNSIPVTSLIKTNLILATCSLLASLTIILLYIFNKNLRSFVFSLVFFLSLSELINSIGNLMSFNKIVSEPSEFICNVQSVLITFTDICSLIWMCIISYTIHKIMTHQNKIINKRKVFIIIGFAFPLIYTIVQATVFFVSERIEIKMVVPDLWCWIYDIGDHSGVVITVYITYWILVIFNFIFICKAISHLKGNIIPDDEDNRKIRKMINKLYLYPIVSGLCFSFATVHRVYQIFYILNDKYVKSNESYRLEIILYLFHGIFMNIRGVLFFVIYGCDLKVRKEFKKIVSWLCLKIFRKDPYKEKKFSLIEEL